ncbi:hypothetical protein BDN67DRAFT_961492 [Paxillus ammoniavirescens]|nr:hypothetical protein BDN67DRAFT_961492 [Paxillus ammoniavirescens]
MSFRSRNAYYLRISADLVLPLYLYLDERHIGWMSDVVLQHVLADLRPLVIPKLQAERDIHFGPGAAPGDKKGIVEVHRGETYQFAYFFRKTEPHSVVTKSRYFVAAPPRSEVAPVSAPAPVAPRHPCRENSKKRRRTRPPAKQSNHKRAKTKGKHKASDNHLDEDILSTEESEQDSDVEASLQGVARMPRRSQRQRRAIAGGYRETDDGVEDVDVDQDVDMASPPGHFETNGEPSTHSSNASAERSPAPDVKPEDVDQPLPVVTEGDEDIVLDSNDQRSPTYDVPDIDFVVDEEEKKPKPLLKLKYQSYTISGHCLCVVVEPWPLQRAVTRLQSVAPLGTVSQRGSVTSALPTSGGSSIGGQRAQTPLFLPELDRASSEAPYLRGRSLPPVPLFYDDTTNDGDDGYSSDNLMDFSQALNSTGHMHANAADDDDMDGAVLFGDADEVREFI